MIRRAARLAAVLVAGLGLGLATTAGPVKDAVVINGTTLGPATGAVFLPNGGIVSTGN